MSLSSLNSSHVIFHKLRNNVSLKYTFKLTTQLDPPSILLGKKITKELAPNTLGLLLSYKHQYSEKSLGFYT